MGWWMPTKMAGVRAVHHYATADRGAACGKWIYHGDGGDLVADQPDKACPNCLTALSRDKKPNLPMPPTEGEYGDLDTEIRELTQFIYAYQTTEDLSDNALVKKFPGLGSTKTWTKFLSGNIVELNVPKWIVEYRQVREQIVALQTRSKDNEPIYDDLSGFMRLRGAFTEALREDGNNRLIIVQGPSGSGKTTAVKLLAQKFGRRIIFCEADETWKESLRAMMGGILNAVGIEQTPLQLRDCERKVIERLSAPRVCLVIDEAHHLGPRTLNLVKTIINQTPGEIILLAMDTLQARLESSAYFEAMQLVHNRLLERIRLDRLEADDVEKILKRRLTWENGDLHKAATALRDQAVRRGHLAFVKLVVRRAARLADGDPMTLEVFVKAMSQTIDKR